MKEDWLHFLRCPVSRMPLRLQVLETRTKDFESGEETIVWKGLLFGIEPFVFPILEGIPRLIVEAIIDYASFLKPHLPDYETRKSEIYSRFGGFMKKVEAKNAATKKSFSQEWSLYQFDADKTWNLEAPHLLDRFLLETNETTDSLKGKWVLDAGCGNGQLNLEMAKSGIYSVGMDFSMGIENAAQKNRYQKAIFIQGDVEFPPFDFRFFDLVHSSGVLIHTQRTELSLSALTPCVKPGGKISLWSYHPRKDLIHQLINQIRQFSSRLPIRVQFYLYAISILPVGLLIKWAKGNRQKPRELMVEILDWFSPQYRWEHEVSEIETWLWKRNFHQIKLTDSNMWGFNLVGIKKMENPVKKAA
jgi:ubiquinone/menaquinone biosynthesis C-methylase UbiE/uncharacterized protein YbaR (Trm112 family)